MSDWSTLFGPDDATARETVIYLDKPEDRYDTLGAVVGIDILSPRDGPIHRRGRFKSNARKQIARAKKKASRS